MTEKEQAVLLFDAIAMQYGLMVEDHKKYAEKMGEVIDLIARLEEVVKEAESYLENNIKARSTNGSTNERPISQFYEQYINDLERIRNDRSTNERSLP